MKAICSSNIGINQVALNEIERPTIKPDHILINVSACGINHGDLAWINGFIPRGAAPESINDVAGVSGAGKVEEIGKNVPQDFKGRKVAFYRALNPSKSKVGAWSEYALMHYLDCVLLPDDAETLEYSGSLVNIVAPYAFIEHTQLNCKKAVIVTAGTSATGQALLGIAQEKNIPVISIVRNNLGKRKLEGLNAKYIIAQSDSDFEKQLEALSQELNATTVFDGVGGGLITKIAPLLPFGSTVYAYGFLAEYDTNVLPENKSVYFNTSLLLMKNLTFTSFSVYANETVKNPEKLKNALNTIKDFVHLPHFKTKVGPKFKFKEYKEALEYSINGSKKGNAVFTP